MRFKIDWASFLVGRKLTVFALFYFVFEGKFQIQASRGAYIRRGDLTEDFLRYDIVGLIFGGAYKWNGLFSEFYGIWFVNYATQTTSCTLKTMQERNLCSQVIYIETILRIELLNASHLSSTLGTRGFFLACDGELRFVGRRPTRVRPKAELTRAETAHEKPLAPRVPLFPSLMVRKQ